MIYEAEKQRQYIHKDFARGMYSVRLGRATGKKFIGRYVTMDKAVRARNIALRERNEKIPD